jgi:AcrR family transcriptional regulator
MTDQVRRNDGARPYQMRRRAESQLDTRRRITESAVELHGTLGPSRTSMSAVAAHAGVRRSTLYRHFPDEAALFEACSAHWNAANPPPDLGTWAQIDSPDARLTVALDLLYAYYGRVGPMLENLFRDEQTMPVVRDRFAAFHGFLATAADTLLSGRRLRGSARERVRAALGHAVAFSTWRSLIAEQGLDPHEASRLMGALVQAAVAGPTAGRQQARRGTA